MVVVFAVDPFERVNPEIERRSDIIGILPNDAAIGPVPGRGVAEGGHQRFFGKVGL